ESFFEPMLRRLGHKNRSVSSRRRRSARYVIPVPGADVEITPPKKLALFARQDNGSRCDRNSKLPYIPHLLGDASARPAGKNVIFRLAGFRIFRRGIRREIPLMPKQFNNSGLVHLLK